MSLSKILTYSEIDREQWGELVKNSSTGTWFQTPEAYSFYESLPDLFKPFVVAVERVSGLEVRELVGICVGYVTKEKSALKQFFTRRAIIIGGPALTEDATEEEVTALMAAVKHSFTHALTHSFIHSPIYVECRNFDDYSRWKGAFAAAGFDYMPHLNFHVDTATDNLSDNRCRQVRKAQATVECLTNEGVNELEIREWYEILKDLYRTRVKTALWPVEFFIEAYRRKIGAFLLIKHEGKIIGGSMVVRDRKCVYEWYACGLNSAYKEQYPSVMTTWAGIQWAKTQGCVRYDMMGAGTPGVPYGVRNYKAEFGGTLVEHGRFLYVNHPLLYRIGAMAVKMMKLF